MTKDEIDSLVQLLTHEEETNMRLGLTLLASLDGYWIYRVLCAWVTRVHDMYRNEDYYFDNGKSYPYKVHTHQYLDGITSPPDVQISVKYPRWGTKDGDMLWVCCFFRNNKRVHHYGPKQGSLIRWTNSLEVGSDNVKYFSHLYIEECAQEFRDNLLKILEHDTT